MTKILGAAVRPRSDVQNALAPILTALDQLLNLAIELSARTKAWSRESSLDNNAFLTKALYGSDPQEDRLLHTLEELRVAKATLCKDIDFWLDTSFDDKTTSGLRKKLFPTGGARIIGGGVVLAATGLVEQLRHLRDEVTDIERRLEHFSDPSFPSPGIIPAQEQGIQSPELPTTEKSDRDAVFIAYSHKNRKWLSRLKIHLTPVLRSKTIDLWDDTMLKPGARWREEIDSALVRASVAVLLISADFLASDFVASIELPAILTAQRSRGLLVLPIFVAPCVLPDELSAFQAVNPPEKPLEALSKVASERVLMELVTAIKKRAAQS